MFVETRPLILVLTFSAQVGMTNGVVNELRQRAREAGCEIDGVEYDALEALNVRIKTSIKTYAGVVLRINTDFGSTSVIHDYVRVARGLGQNIHEVAQASEMSYAYALDTLIASLREKGILKKE